MKMKNENSKIMVCGDVHGEYARLNALINRHGPTLVLQCGDFGYFPKWHNHSYVNAYGNTITMDQYTLKTKGVPVHWCDGNHEDHHALRELVTKDRCDGVPVVNAYYRKRGSTMTLPDGRNVLFMGGAFSIDRAWRKLNESYWIEEIITEDDLKDLPNVDIDIVISHTAPLCFKFKLPMGKEIHDPSRDILQYVFEKYHPKQWKFGHFHTYTEGKYRNCYWEGLSHSTDPVNKWWAWLK